MPTGIFGPEKEDVAGGWRRLRVEGFHNLYVSSDAITGDEIKDGKIGEARSMHGRDDECIEMLSEYLKGIYHSMVQA
jgi:hypothetical protein